MKYPADIVFDDGWGRIHQGWDLDPVMLELDYADAQGGVGNLTFDETGLAYIPRIKWCDKWGNNCDNVGEWHSEWIALMVDNTLPDKNRFTIVREKK